MKVFWEGDEWSGSQVEPSVTCLTWMPCKNSPDEGYLGCGSESGAVGITRTEIRPATIKTAPDKRHNFNLRGHHSKISLALWNQTQTKLATCDENGIIYIWVPYEERWSVELVNDRGVKVRDFSWSPSGASALICYEDNFVLIGSATGQRIWSHSFAQTILCCTWSPDSRQVLLGTDGGVLHVLTDQGVAISEYTIWSGHPLTRLAWSGAKDDFESTLVAYFGAGTLYFLQSFDDPDPVVLNSGIDAVGVQWNLSSDYVALVGKRLDEGLGDKICNELHVYNAKAQPVLKCSVPLETPITAFTWLHDTEGLVVCGGGQIRVCRLWSQIPPLHALSSYAVWSRLPPCRSQNLDSLPVPAREKTMLSTHDYHIVKCRIPRAEDLSESVCVPSAWRWYCTIKPVPRKAQTYTLFMEHMGGLVPVLVGRQINRLLPEFEIRLCRPKKHECSSSGVSRSRSSTPDVPRSEDNTDSERAEDTPPPCASAKPVRGNFQRNSMWRRSKRQIQALMQRAQSSHQTQLTKYHEERLVQVTSNVWCTRFKVTGMASSLLPPYLGQVCYKTSVLHLQPRQMTVQVVDLERRSALSSPVPPPIDTDVTDGGPDDHLLVQQSDAGPPVAPLDSEIFVGPAASTPPAADPLAEEQQLLQQVLSEFSELRLAVDQHIGRMRQFAVELQHSSEQLTNRPTTSRVIAIPGIDNMEQLLMSDVPAPSSLPTTSKAPETQPFWKTELESIDFIDDDESLVVSEMEARRLRPRALSSGEPVRPPSQPQTCTPARLPLARDLTGPAFSRPNEQLCRGNSKQLKEITSVLDKLYKLANELTTRPAISDGSGGSFLNPAHHHSLHQAGGKISPHRNQPPPALQMDTEPEGGFWQLRARIRDIAQRVSQLERRINYGNELLDEVRTDLQKRVQHIRHVLGERQSISGDDQSLAKRGWQTTKAEEKEEEKKEPDPVIELQNKTPFWNEQSQVYQLDFGGRVTQESAKNFQIEHNDVQVMQFGRIEGGAYTLDFQAPFSAVQAFAVALASITQRLK